MIEMISNIIQTRITNNEQSTICTIHNLPLAIKDSNCFEYVGLQSVGSYLYFRELSLSILISMFGESGWALTVTGICGMVITTHALSSIIFSISIQYDTNFFFVITE